ncbi:MAG: hypothetical protein ACLFNN_02540 [Candidatus Paceibacterota bacterium]
MVESEDRQAEARSAIQDVAKELDVCLMTEEGLKAFTEEKEANF